MRDDIRLDNLFVDLHACIYIPGLLHIAHNCVNDFNVVLADSWRDFVHYLKHVCRLLSRRRARTRLLQTCFLAEPFCHVTQKFHNFNQHVYEGRWGSVAAAIGELLLLELPLRGAWSLPAYSHGQRHERRPAPGANDQDNEHSTDFKVIDAAIKSTWWAEGTGKGSDMPASRKAGR